MGKAIMTDVPPPADLEAERATLGSLMIDSTEAAPKCAAAITAFDFYLESHQWIYSAIIALPIDSVDILTVATELRSRGLLDECGGEPYLADLMASVPSALNVEHYAAIVADNAIRRRMLAACSLIAAKAFKTDEPAAGLLEYAQAQAIRAAGSAQRNLRTNEAIAQSMLQEYERRVAGEGQSSIRPGIPDLDDMWAMKPGRLSVIGARPGVGKSALMVHIAMEAVKQGKTAAFFTLEMSEEEIAGRFVTRISDRTYDVEQVRHWSDEMHAGYQGALEKFTRLPITLAYLPGLSYARLRAECQRIKAQKGLDLVCVDYIQIMGEHAQKGENRLQVLEGLARSMKIMAGELGVHVITGSQLNRADLARPGLSNLREAGIENDPDTVLLMSRPDELKPQEILFDVAKNRDGRVGTVNMLFDGSKMRFFPVTRMKLN